MQKHIVMIIDYYYPNESPTSKVADAYINLVDNAKIDVICMPSAGQNEEYKYKGKQVYVAKDWYISLMNHLRKHKLLIPLAHLVKLYNSIYTKFVHPRDCYYFFKTALQKLEEINRKEKIDCIFSVSAPMASHVAALHYRQKHPDTVWVACNMDSYTAQNKFNKRRESCFKFEKAVLSQADSVLLSEEIYANMQYLYRNFKEKCVPLPYLLPNVDQNAQCEGLFPKDKINMVYAGRFYKNIRNPEYLLKIAVALDSRYLLHLFWDDGCVDMVQKYAKKLGGKIVLHDCVDAEKIREIYNTADLLVTVGNSLPEYKPSKIFEYIASGKPILNIYYEGLRDDSLDKYPLALQIGRNTSIEVACNKIDTFMLKANGQFVSKETIEKIYINHTKNNIKNLINEVFK